MINVNITYKKLLDEKGEPVLKDGDFVLEIEEQKEVEIPDEKQPERLKELFSKASPEEILFIKNIIK